jgi:rhamnosyl/mannosyltransferase
MEELHWRVEKAVKILEVATETPPYESGVSRLVGILTTGLRERGHQVDVLTPKIKFREFKFSAIGFRKYNEYDIIHVHGPTPFLSDLVLLTNDVSKIVFTYHAEITWLSEKLASFYRKLHRSLARRCRAIIVHSYDYARLFGSRNVKVVHMPSTFGSRTQFDIEQKSDSFMVLYVGQFRPFKGLDVLLRTAALLKNVNFILAGKGYLKKEIVHKARNLKNVYLPESTSDKDLEELYTKAHVICLPSVNTTEAYGLVLIEGALHGCVPIASNLLGVRENVSQLKGLTFKTRSYEDLSQKISMLAHDGGLWAKLAQKSQQVARNYTRLYNPKYYVTEHEKIFIEIRNEYAFGMKKI